MRQIDGKHIAGDPTNRRAPNQLGFLPLKMIRPPIPAWMKQPNDFLGFGIEPSDIRPFVVVTAKTRKRQILQFIPAMMFPGNDVVDLESQRIVLLWHPAVLAYRARPLPHPRDEG
jgi:hypothetical protein